MYHTSLSRKSMIPFSSSNAENILSNAPVQKHSSLPLQCSFPSHEQNRVSPSEPRTRSLIDTHSIRDSVRALPVATSNHNVIYLSQLNSETLEQFTAKCASLKAQQRAASLKNAAKPPHTREGSDSTGLKSPGIVKSQHLRPVEMPPSNPPRSGFTPTTMTYSKGNITLMSTTQRGRSKISPIPYLSNAYSDVEHSTTESGIADECSNAIIDGTDHCQVNMVKTDHRQVNVVVSPSTGGPANVKQIEYGRSRLKSKSPSPAISVII